MSWTAPDTTGFVFVQYDVHRRWAVRDDPWGDSEGPGPWVRIARIFDDGVTTYTDYGCGAGVEYEYAVTWWGDNGTEVLESDKQAVPVVGAVAWRGSYLHDAGTPGYYVPVLASTLDQVLLQGQVRRRSRGRSQSTTFTSQRFEREYEVVPGPHGVRDRAVWRALALLLERQFTASATLALRVGHSGEVVFGTLVGDLSRATGETLERAGLRFQESHYDEAVT